MPAAKIGGKSVVVVDVVNYPHRSPLNGLHHHTGGKCRRSLVALDCGSINLPRALADDEVSIVLYGPTAWNSLTVLCLCNNSSR